MATEIEDTLARLCDRQTQKISELIAVRDRLITALEKMFEADEEYSKEFNPSGKIKKVCDWALLNENWMYARKALAEAKKLKCPKK